MKNTILVIDDDKMVTFSLSTLLTKEGYETITSNDGQDALDKIIKEGDFDLIVCDIRLSDMNGFDTAKKIKEHLKANNKPDIPIIFITGYTDTDLHIKAQELGRVFLKPFDNKELLKNIAITIERVPHDKELDYNKDFVEKRRQWLTGKTGIKFSHVSSYSIDPEDCKGNIENFVGVAQVPIGVVGPLLVKGDFAKGTFYVPFATTEGALIETYQRGAIAVTKAGGVKVFVNKDANHLDPIFIFKDSKEARDFQQWINNNFSRLKEMAETTTGFGKLISITPYLIGRRVITDFSYYTSDAMGANMINIATEKVCEYIIKEVKMERYLLRSNFSSEKKASAANLLIGYGKEVIAEATIPAKIIRRFLFSTPDDIASAWHSWALGSFSNGMFGMHAHFANGAAAIFIACGQDVAHVSNISVGILSFELTNEKDLYMCIKLPNIIVGTVGGGTALGTQRECLEMIGCYGKDKATKFAEIVGATLLAGELGICAGITSEHFLEPHKRARAYTREKTYQQKE